MNKLHIIIIIEWGLFAIGCSARVQLMEAFTQPLNSDSIAVFSQPARFHSYLQPDEEAGWIVHVMSEKNGFFEVVLPKEYKSRQKKIWVKAGDIGVIVQNYTSTPIFMYSKPTTKSLPIKIITSSIIGQIYDIQAHFVLLEIIIDGEKIRGWVQKEYLCGNPYTTCS